MKQIQLTQFDPARLLTYLLSRFVDAHAVDEAARKSGSDKTGDEQAHVLCSPTRASEQILETAERRWPSRYIELEQWLAQRALCVAKHDLYGIPISSNAFSISNSYALKRR